MLTGRFAPWAPHWQPLLWARQFALFGVLLASSLANLHMAAESAEQKAVQLSLGLVALLVLLASWAAHHRTQPYA